MAGRHRQRSQRGAALLVFLVLLVMGALTWVVSNLTPETVEAARARKTADALAQARYALLGYALKHRDLQAAKDADSNGLDDRTMYGYLPLPDLGSSRNQNLDPICLDGAGNPIEGCDANYFTGLNFDANGIGPTVVGRFPWRTFGIAPLRDGHGECLWLIVSSLQIGRASCRERVS
jgi:type II secretory pathway pseudopilin PulG